MTPRSAVFALLALSGAAFAQSNSPVGAQGALRPPVNGVSRADASWHAIVHARVTTQPGTVIEDCTIVMREGVVTLVQAGAAAPEGARVWDASGLDVYAGLVEPYLSVETPRTGAGTPGAHWNSKVTPERSVLDGAGPTAEQRKTLRALGYGAALAIPSGGIFRGTGAVMTLGEPGDAAMPQLPRVIAQPVVRGAGFEYGGDEYPGSKMGAIALMRQTLSDAAWVSAGGSPESVGGTRVFAPGLSSLAGPGAWVFEAAEPLDAWRFAKVIAEFRPGEKIVAVGTGEEYQRLAALRGSGVSVVSPLAFPKRPRVGTAAERDAVGLNALMEWEQAPTNLRRLEAEGLKPSITASRLPKGADFMENLRLAVGAGLDQNAALSMLTIRPAELVGAAGSVGRVAPGMRANLLVTKGGFFDADRVVRDVWVDGTRYEITAPTPALSRALEGRWALALSGDGAANDAVLVVGDKGEVSIERPGEAPKAEAPREGGDAKPEEKKEPEKPKPRVTKARSTTRVENRLDFLVDAAALSAAPAKPEQGKPKDAEEKPDGERAAASAMVSLVLDRGALRGRAEVVGGGTFGVTGTTLADESKPDAKDKEAEKKQDPALAGIPETLTLPFGAYGLAVMPEQETVLLTGATVWTNGPQGVIRNGSVLISGGKIVGVGAGPIDTGASGKPARTIDAKGLHITTGIIDCHSHTGITGGVNEGTQSCTSEVRIFDVINPDDVDWYRQLAGGVIGANQLHGSANAIGGQNSVVKNRWGCETPDDMRVKGAIPGIKFALGENVKQANWGERFATRYPQTRMGVETFIRDRFLSAVRYAERRKSWDAMPAAERAGKSPPLRDLELDTLAEILAGERLIHCHSYRQDEILMLCRMADEFGFKVGTFQHVLEGYKVADAIKKSAIGASSFSDWWAYKWEVYDAIPSNGSIMHNQGVVVSFNSDSNELARRLNAEAGKAVKYGGVPPEEALKFVTLNPARQLKIDSMTGSIEAGKDADIAVWSGDPLSPTSRCVRTFVDGRELFSLEKDAEHRERIASERARIIAKLTAEALKREGRGGGGGGGGRGGDGAAGAGGAQTDEPATDRPRRGRQGAPPSEFMRSGAMVPAGGDEEETERLRWMFQRERLRQRMEFLVRNGFDPAAVLPGVCGCDF